MLQDFENVSDHSKTCIKDAETLCIKVLKCLLDWIWEVRKDSIWNFIACQAVLCSLDIWRIMHNTEVIMEYYLKERKHINILQAARECAKLPVSRAFVPHVPTYLACLRVLRAHVPYVLGCFSAFLFEVPSFLYVPYLPLFLSYLYFVTCFTCLLFFTCLRCFHFLRTLRALIF